MSESTVQADAATVQELLTLVEDSLKQAKQAYSELAQEREEKIRLEKIASEPKTIDKDLVDRTVSMLVRYDFLDESHQEKFASELASKPENALKLVSRLLEISASASYSEGRGIPKQASTQQPDSTTEDTSAWLKVVQEGA